MILLILAGLAYSIWYDSLPASVLTAALILYRAQRPSTFLRRLREAWYLRSAGVDEE